MSEVEAGGHPDVILFVRAEDAKYREYFVSNGYKNLNFCPILEFRYLPVVIRDYQISSWEEFECICTTEFRGLIVTSKEAANSLSHSLGPSYLHQQTPSLSSQIDFKNDNRSLSIGEDEIIECFVVGKSTRKAFEQVCSSNSNRKWKFMGEHCQNARNLAEEILQHHRSSNNSSGNKQKQKPWLFLCGKNRREELPEFLKGESVNVEECHLYETHVNTEKFQDQFQSITSDSLAGQSLNLQCVFFSPSGIDGCLEVILSADTGINLQLISIGPTTASHLKKRILEFRPEQRRSVSAFQTATDPSPQGILEAIKSLPPNKY